MSDERQGTAVTRLLGRLEILHRDGTIVFRLRNPMDIKKRRVTTVLRITNAGHIPLIEEGRTLEIDCMKVGLDVVKSDTDRSRNG